MLKYVLEPEEMSRLSRAAEKPGMCWLSILMKPQATGGGKNDTDNPGKKAAE